MKNLRCRDPKVKRAVLEEVNFEIDAAFILAQRGLPTPYNRIDFYAITQKVPETPEFLSELQQLYRGANENQDDHSLILAFNPEYWNNIMPENPVEVPKYSTNYQKLYRSNIQLLFLLKKNEKTAASDLINEAIREFIKKYKLVGEDENPFTAGMRQPNGTATDTVLGGKFNDKMELPKDPYKFYQHGLIGYSDPSHMGGSYLFTQKIDMKWNELETQSHHWETIIGRKDREDNDTVFSQNWCPHSHIKSSRIKDDFGNPTSLVRQSKLYFDEEPEPGQLTKERGTFFCGYLNSVKMLEKMCENQIVNNDSLTKFFNPIIGAILYVPNMFELNTEVVMEEKHCKKLKKLSVYHKIDWEQCFPSVNYPSPSPYLFYSRNQYMQKMGTADDDDDPTVAKTLIPPTARTLRILTKTFALWQDTWYYDRRQQELKHLSFYLQKKHIAESVAKITKVDVSDYSSLDITVRQALAVYVSLAHVLTSDDYGCRGPNSEGHFGAGTFHVEPEDLLAGGEANLTFGQGKHLIAYLTSEEVETGWYNGACLSEHSGVGHVVPHMDEIFEVGLQAMIEKFWKLSEAEKQTKPKRLFFASFIALLGLQKYFENYADLCHRRIKFLAKSETASIKSLQALAHNLTHISKHKPQTLVQGAQLALSIFVSLHITGEPVSIGRLDQVLGKFAPQDYTQIRDEDQEVIDHFWIKVGEKTNLNKAFFEDHQKWGNLAMGGMASPYPQGASFNQWGHQLTVGGSKRDGSLAYNSVTMMCLRAARRIPVNAPCLGLRVRKDMPKVFLEEAAKAILSGGAHPILLNDDRVIPAIMHSGSYKIDKNLWDSNTSIQVPYEKYDPRVKIEDARDYSSDGCYEFLMSGKCWFCLSGLPVLQPLEYLLNEGKDLIDAGPRYIHGKRTHYIEYKLHDLQKGTYEEFEEKFFQYFRTTVTKNFTFQLSNYGKVTDIYPTSLLNAFTAGLAERKLDFYSNGATYNLFAPQFTGISNLVNALWHLKKYVWDNPELTLAEIRQMLLNNWGETIAEPFIPEHLPNITKGQFIAKCKFWRLRIKASKEKFGLNDTVSEFGLRIAQKIADITVDLFANPKPNTLNMMKDLTSRFTNENATFGFQAMPGCGTFENYEDNGVGCGPSFDGRLKGETLSEDMSLQNYLMDQQPSNKKYPFKQVLARYKDPQFSSGSVLDFNIDEDIDEDYLVSCLEDFATKSGPNVITVTVCDRKHMEELETVANKDLLRFRMGGWSEFGVAMFPKLLDQQIRRIRTK